MTYTSIQGRGAGLPRLAVAALVVAGLVSSRAAGAWGQAEATGPAVQSPAAAADGGLALSRVVLFSSGVAYYEREGKVSGDETVDLLFPVADINDLLKSMVVRDLDGGLVGGVSYGSKDPLERTLKGYAIDLSEDPALAAILAQARGEPVKILAPTRMAGTIVGVEKRAQGEDASATYLNLLTANGLVSRPLSSISEIRFANPRLDRDLREALSVMASSHERDKKRVSVSFNGQGARRVRVGYLLASPVWKTSYRLVLSEPGAAPGPAAKAPAQFLQGWGIVENTTDEAWKGVQVSLVSGRPVSFVMDLYQPLYIQRPTVQPQTSGPLQPQRYEESLVPESAKAAGASMPAAPPAARPSMRAADAAAQPASPGFDLSRGVEAAAQGGEVGSFFRYVIDKPVNLARHESAMLPIVNQAIEGSRVSIYNESVLAKHPLLGVRLSNTTGLDLMAGPITVFDGGVYAGDALIDDLPAAGERLISYAIDLDTEVATAGRSAPEDLLTVRIVKGTLIATRLQRKERTYTIKSTAPARDLLIEHPWDPNWELESPATAQERTREAYRFAVRLEGTAGAAATAAMTVAEKRTVSQSVLLSSVADDMIAFYVQARAVSARVKDALRAWQARKAALADTVAQRQDVERRQQQVVADQTRVRENMGRLDRDSALYKRYVTQLDSQENELAAMRDRIDSMRQKEVDQRKSLDDVMRALDAE